MNYPAFENKIIKETDGFPMTLPFAKLFLKVYFLGVIYNEEFNFSKFKI